jgi:hypothetical protein
MLNNYSISPQKKPCVRFMIFWGITNSKRQATGFPCRRRPGVIMMMPMQAHVTQVRRANLTGEIPDAMSFVVIRLYGSGVRIPGASRSVRKFVARGTDPGTPGRCLRMRR